jgi:single-strand DNA-binding protein
MNYNKTIFGGRICRDLELKYVGETQLCDFAIASNKKIKDKEYVTFLDCKAWGKTAELIATHFSKGREIMVDGSLRTEEWDDKTTGQKKSKIVLNVDSFQFCGSSKDESMSQPQITQAAVQPAPQSAPTFTPPVQNNAVMDDVDDSDIPF